MSTTTVTATEKINPKQGGGKPSNERLLQGLHAKLRKKFTLALKKGDWQRFDDLAKRISVEDAAHRLNLEGMHATGKFAGKRGRELLCTDVINSMVADGVLETRDGAGVKEVRLPTTPAAQVVEAGAAVDALLSCSQVENHEQIAEPEMTYLNAQPLAGVLLEIVQIRIDGDTQTRWGLDEATVTAYAEALDSGAEFPPVVVFKDEESNHWLADGFHRVEVYRRASKPAVFAIVRDGTRRDAVLYSVGANAAHGLQRTNADKRRAVNTLLEDAEWAQWSDRKIAEQCRVSNRFVGNVRQERREQNWASVNDSQMDAASDTAVPDDEPAVQEEAHNSPPATERKVERNGTTYTMQTGGIGKAQPTTGNPETPPAPDDSTPVSGADDGEAHSAPVNKLRSLGTALAKLQKKIRRAEADKEADHTKALEEIRQDVFALAKSLKR